MDFDGSYSRAGGPVYGRFSHSRNQITSIDKDAWRAELKLHAELFEKLAYHLPQELKDNMAKLEQRLNG